MATIEQRITWSELRSRAHGLRLRSLKAGEAGLSMRVTDVLEILPLPYDPEPLPDHATTEEIAEAEREPLDFAEDVLKRHGVRSRPAPGDAGINGVVILRASNRFALQGAIAIAIIALLGAGVASKIGFVLLAPVALVGVWLLWKQTVRLDRFVPRIVPRGRILGALLMIILLGITTLVAVQPARKWMRNRGNVANAVALSVQAEARLTAGDLVGARASVDQALQFAPQLGQVQSISQKLMVAQINANTNAQINGQAAAQAAYDRAEADFAADRWPQAIAAMAALGGFSDAPTRLALIRDTAAVATLKLAERALEASDAHKAFSLYSKAMTYDPAARKQSLIKRIFKALNTNS
ncbi:MAG: hypothetical protein EXQ67_05920 [Thermoleophilia bacterium]|nr:hypothetical protein [Thermoleophilia bacterium]